MLKRCETCREEKDLSCFGKETRMKDGLCNQCKSCLSKRKRKYRTENPEKCRENALISYYNNRDKKLEKWKKKYQEIQEEYCAKRRQKYAEDKERIVARRKEIRRTTDFKERNRQWARNHYQKTAKKKLPQRQAHQMVSYAIKLGVLMRPDKCENCGLVGKTEGHHEDYTRPLEVKWLCNRCHEDIHHGK